MMQSKDEFRANLVTFSERALRVKDHLKNEEATKVALVLPFIALLGFDDRDPTEVSAEHASDFSEKYRNRVDYAILMAMTPVIAIECKSIGNGKKDDRGQLKAYFNASKTVKLGILTDGFIYEFFVDSEEPNMMDDEPFIVLNLDEVAKAQISETLLDSIFALTKGRFDPETIGENAKRSLTHHAFFEYLSRQFADPSPSFTRFLLQENQIKHVRNNAMDGYRSIAKSAFNDVFTANVLRRLDIGEPKGPPSVHLPSPDEAKIASTAESQRAVVTTPAELAAFDSIKMRLAFLVQGDVALYENIRKIDYKDYQGKMVVFYEKERKGRLLDIIETREGDSVVFQLAETGESASDVASLDRGLIDLFRKRVEELGSK